jgi:prolyl-tRNA editing enzyme YbaK/EbsC (Cys-tRNA(Pro) deacylase)
LQQQKLPYRVIDLKEEAFTVTDVVDAGIKRDEVVKTLVIRVGDGSFIALALRGSDRVDFKKVRRLFGSKSELAKPEEVLRVVGVPIGAVCPVLVGIPLYFDHKVMDLENVHFGSGDLMHGLGMKLSVLLKVVGDYKVEELNQSDGRRSKLVRFVAVKR